MHQPGKQAAHLSACNGPAARSSSQGFVGCHLYAQQLAVRLAVKHGHLQAGQLQLRLVLSSLPSPPLAISFLPKGLARR